MFSEFSGVLAWVLSISGIILAASGIYVFWKKGGNQASSDANVALLQLHQANKIQIEQAQKDILGLQDRERKHLGEIGRLNGVLEEKDKQIAVLQTVDITKNPMMLKFIENSAMREEKILNALTNIGTFMQNINKHFELAHPVGSGAAGV